MDAKEQLRAYLEQRREQGESELVLDALSTEDVLRMVGAVGRARTPGARPVDSAPRIDAGSTTAPVAHTTRGHPPAADAVPGPPREEPPASADWRSVLASAGSAPRQVPASPPTEDASRTPAESERAPSPPGASSAAGQARKRWRISGVEYTAGLRVERPPLLPDAPAWPALEQVVTAIGACRACDLHATATKHVPGVGNPEAEVMVVGEAPGEQEDLQGEPFVGPAGQLLTKILGAINLPRESVYICNVLKHRPPGNRNPLPEEVRACAPFLQAQIDLVQPKMILAFGTFAAQSLLNTKLAIGKLRQQVHAYQGIPLIATYHPAALLRNDAWKRPTWDDMKLARRILDATVRA